MTAVKRGIRAERAQNSLIILSMHFLHECPTFKTFERDPMGWL